LGHDQPGKLLPPRKIVQPEPILYVSIASGMYHNLAIDSNHQVWAFGNNQYGQLAVGDLLNHDQPVRIERLSQPISKVYCGGYYSFFQNVDGYVWACGDNRFGQLAFDDTVDRCHPHKNLLLTNMEIFPGKRHTIFVDPYGLVYSCGYNNYGQLGLGMDYFKNINSRNTNTL
jgi:alpha-tubulin suppressor-like RCC1 family protein